MQKVNDIFDQGPQAVLAWFSRSAADPSFTDMDLKELADICWTRAGTLARAQSANARDWARAALAGYEFLSKHGGPVTARSAGENAAALRSWKLLAEGVSTA